MSNSPLVDYIKLSPNKNSPRNHKIDTITIHCVVGQCTVEALGAVFAPTTRQGSSNYGIGYDGRIGMYVEEKDRSWCSSSSANDHRAITIEVASDTTHPYAVTEAAYNSLIDLCADICKRNGIKKLLWKGDKSLIGQVDKQNMTAHRWFAATGCPGDYLYQRYGDIANKVNKKLNEGENEMYIKISGFKSTEEAEKLLALLKNAELVCDESAPAEIKVGSSVKVKQGAKTYDGVALASFVYDRVHIVTILSGDRAVISYDGIIVAAVNVKDLILIY